MTKRKCGDNFVHLQRGSDKTQAKTNDTIPHTWIVWDMRKELHSHITIQEIGVVRSSFCFFETVRFLCKDCENTFYVCCLGNNMPFSTTKLENYSQMNNTRCDIVFKK